VYVELSTNHVELYASLVAGLTNEIQSKIENLFVYADQRKAHRGELPGLIEWLQLQQDFNLCVLTLQNLKPLKWPGATSLR